MRRPVALLAVAALLASLCGQAARAQAPPAAADEQRNLLERLALARARADLWRQVAALPIRPGLSVGQWANRDAGLDRALRLWVRARPAAGNPRIYSDSTADGDVRLETAELLRTLQRLRSEFSPDGGQPVTDADLAEAARRWPVLWGAGQADKQEQAAAGKRPRGWEDVTAEGVELARRAAAADALAALLDQAGTLKISAARRLREFFDAGAELRLAVAVGLEQHASVQIETALDQVAVAEASITLPALIRVLTQAHQEKYKGADFHAADFREMALLADRERLEAVGLACPPASALVREPYELLDLDAPAWADSTLSAVGRSAGGAGAAAPSADAARLDAVDQLRQKAEALPLRGGATVEQFLGYHTDLKEDVVLWLSGARQVGAPAAPATGGIEVRAELRAKRLWHILRRGMKVIEVDPPPTSAPATRPASDAREGKG